MSGSGARECNSIDCEDSSVASGMDVSGSGSDNVASWLKRALGLLLLLLLLLLPFSCLLSDCSRASIAASLGVDGACSAGGSCGRTGVDGDETLGTGAAGGGEEVEDMLVSPLDPLLEEGA